jgi:hypothetical protein
MANYPTTLDNFDDPSGSAAMNSGTRTHSQRHKDLNDVVEAVEAKLGVGAAPASGASAGDVLTADGDGSSAWEPPTGAQVLIRAATGTTDTLLLTDANNIVEYTNASPVVATVPPAADVAWELGTIISLYASGAGGLTIAAGSGVTIRNNSGAITQYGEVSLRYRGANEWVRVGGPAPAAGALAFIAQQVVAGSVAANIDFSSIPATYESLVLELMGAGDAAALAVNALMRFNNDSGADYYYQLDYANGATPAGAASSGVTSGRIGVLSAASAGSTNVGAIRVQIPNYARTIFRKQYIAQGGRFGAGDTGSEDVYGMWASTAAINRITLLLSSGNFALGSVATLYGVKGSA